MNQVTNLGMIITKAVFYYLIGKLKVNNVVFYLNGYARRLEVNNEHQTNWNA
jgi:hypothetical protein